MNITEWKKRVDAIVTYKGYGLNVCDILVWQYEYYYSLHFSPREAATELINSWTGSPLPEDMIIQPAPDIDEYYHCNF